MSSYVHLQAVPFGILKVWLHFSSLCRNTSTRSRKPSQKTSRAPCHADRDLGVGGEALRRLWHRLEGTFALL